jgi:uncharacterized membrane protein YgdD (TMEM256/DUF423 family)
MSRSLLLTGSICGGLAVALGAFGAHALREFLDDEHLRIYHTGVEYQFYHSLAILAAAILSERLSDKWIRMSGWLFFAGIIFFSGSLYILALASTLSYFGILTPIGGLFFITGWTALATGAYTTVK